MVFCFLFCMFDTTDFFFLFFFLWVYIFLFPFCPLFFGLLFWLGGLLFYCFMAFFLWVGGGEGPEPRVGGYGVSNVLWDMRELRKVLFMIKMVVWE